MGKCLSVKRQSHSEKKYEVRKNNLDLYLEDVLEKECQIKVTDEESKFIQTGIESIVQGIVNTVLEDEEFNRVTKEFADDADRRGRTVTHGPTNIINVGSFYEQTKNGFPDEFDFIFVIGCIERQLYDKNQYYTLEFGVGDVLCDIRDQNLLVEYSASNLLREAKLILDTNGMSSGFTNGPAFCLPFIYENSGAKRSITADLVLAWRVTDCSVEEHANKFCGLEPFRREIVSTGSFLLMADSRVSFTETEVNFIRNKLSATHVKVYRILKYLINGHDDGEELEKILESEKKPLSSYNIKTIIIHHHYACTNSEVASIGSCTLQALNEIYKHETMETFPSLCFNFRDRRKLCLRNYLKELVEVLNIMKEDNDAYDYERCKIEKSVSKKYIEDNNTDLNQ